MFGELDSYSCALFPEFKMSINGNSDDELSRLGGYNMRDRLFVHVTSFVHLSRGELGKFVLGLTPEFLCERRRFHFNYGRIRVIKIRYMNRGFYSKLLTQYRTFFQTHYDEESPFNAKVVLKRDKNLVSCSLIDRRLSSP